MGSYTSFAKTVFIITSSTVTLLALIGFWQHRRKNQTPKEWQPVGKVTELNLYPLKSGKKVPLNAGECTKLGFQQSAGDEKVMYQMRDRELIVFRESDLEFRTARTHPKLVLIAVRVHGQSYFALDAPGMPTLYVKRPKADETPEFHVRCWSGEPIAARDCGDQAAAWLSQFILGCNVFGLRLAHQDGRNFKRDIENSHESTVRHYKNLNNQTTGIFSDLASFLLINKSSVDDLASRVDNAKFTVDNFRPNIVVECEAYAEDEWDWVKIGDVIFRVCKPCTRCILTTIDPTTGQRDADGEPLKTLRTYRLNKDPVLRELEHNAPIMGVNLGVFNLGRIHVGDTIFVGK